MTPTLEELRDLSRRSRREQRAGGLAMLGALLAFPLVGFIQVAQPAWGAWALYGAAALAGGLFVWYSRVAGETRGAFRKTFRRMKDEKGRA